MITDADITKLKKTFVTKDDLKKELDRFATKDDLKKELGRYATKDDLKESIADVRVEIGEVRDTVESTAAAVARIENALDGLSGAIQDLRTENGAGAVHLARHDRQIEALALATNIALPE